jgi:hypothetical protein
VVHLSTLVCRLNSFLEEGEQARQRQEGLQDRCPGGPEGLCGRIFVLLYLVFLFVSRGFFGGIYDLARFSWYEEEEGEEKEIRGREEVLFLTW